MFHRCASPLIIFFGSIVLSTSYDNDRIYFDGPMSRHGTVVDPHEPVDSLESNTTAQLEFARALSRMNSFEEFLAVFNDSQDTTIHSRIGGDERNNAEEPQPAGCKVQPTVVKLSIPDMKTSEMIWPECTRVDRCSGCCSGDQLACEPTETITRNFQVVVYTLTFRNGRPRKQSRFEIVSVEQHVNCLCGCREKAKDCNSKQDYNPQQCACLCRNEDERRKCLATGNKVWDKKTCSCSCDKIRECSHGNYFDTKSCRCKLSATTRNRSSFSNGELTSSPTYVTDEQEDTGELLPPVIYSLDPNNPRRRPKEDPEYKK